MLICFTDFLWVYYMKNTTCNLILASYVGIMNNKNKNNTLLVRGDVKNVSSLLRTSILAEP